MAFDETRNSVALSHTNLARPLFPASSPTSTSFSARCSVAPCFEINSKHVFRFSSFDDRSWMTMFISSLGTDRAFESSSSSSLSIAWLRTHNIPVQFIRLIQFKIDLQFFRIKYQAERVLTYMALALASSNAVTHDWRSTSFAALMWNVWVPPFVMTNVHESTVWMRAPCSEIVPRHVCDISA